METAKRQRVSNEYLAGELVGLKEDVSEIKKMLCGNGQPGFIAVTQREISDVKLRESERDAIDKERSRSSRRMTVFYTILIDLGALVLQAGLLFAALRHR